MISRLLIGLLAALSVCGGQVHQASGTVRQNGVVMEPVAAVAVWDELEKALVIGVFPFAVNEEDAQFVAVHGALALAESKPSPAPNLWRRPPVVGLVLRFAERPAGFRMEDLTGVSVRLTGIQDPAKSFGVSRRTAAQFAQEVKRLEGTLGEQGGEVRLSVAGSDYTSEARFDWTIELESAVLVRGGNKNRAGR